VDNLWITGEMRIKYIMLNGATFGKKEVDKVLNRRYNIHIMREVAGRPHVGESFGITCRNFF